MKKYLLIVIAVFLTLPVLAQESSDSSDTESTYIFIRHAEKADDGTSDPDLSTEGIKRANAWIEIFEEYDISAIYSTPYKRTQQTAAPIAEHLGLDVQEYGFSNVDSLVTRFKDIHQQTAVLIVGHSNTTAMLVNVMMKQRLYENLDESDYETYFIVTMDGEKELLSEKLKNQGSE